MKDNSLEIKGDINQNKSIDTLKNIKNKYILQLIFNNLEEGKLLNIVKYNKVIKKRININNNDYEEYSEIEIEIKPNYNKKGQFINIKKEDNKYYHIYFNNDEKEIKRISLNKKEKIKNIKIIIDYQVESFQDLFKNSNLISSIYIKKFHRNNIHNISFMFSGCSSLKEINLSNFNTKNVNNMCGMFKGCSSLKKINLINFNYNNVTNMSEMFHG